MRARRWIIAGVVAAVLLLGGRAVAVAVLEQRWYAAMGAADVWFARVATSAALRLACGGLAALFAFANLLAVRHSVVSLVLPRRVGNIEIGEEVPGRSLVMSAAVLSAVLGILLALPIDGWSAALLARNGQPFGEKDPYFQHDLGFFVYWLPLETALYEWALVTIAVVSAVVLLLYALTPSLRWERGTLYVSSYVRRHLTVLGGVLLLALAWSYRLGNYRLLLEGSGAGGAFSSIDHRVGIPGGLLLSFVSVGAALVVLWAGSSGQTRLAFFAVTAVIVAAAGRAIAPYLARPGAGDAVRERPYLGTRAGYSRRAFAVDRIERPATPFEAATLDDLAAMSSSWDSRAVAAALDPSGEASDSAIAVGFVPTARGLEAIAPIAVEASDDAAGWSAVRVLADAADAQGDLVRLGDEESVPAAGPLVVRPGVDGHALVADATGRVVGVPLRSRAAHLLYGWALQDLGVAAGDAARARTTLVLHRDVRARVRALAPFFLQGSRVSPILAGDSLYWALELYSASRFYPLSEPVTLASGAWWYLHRAAVALVHAQTGRTLLVADSAADPIAASWRRIFPRLLRDARTLPPQLAAALPPAAEELLAQSAVFARYGSRAEGTAVRARPARDGADPRLAGDLTPMRLADGRTALALPLLDAADRVTGLVFATGGPARSTYWQPLTTPAPRWPVAVDRLRGVARAVPAARQPVVRGPVRVLPVDGSVALVQSAYTWRPGRPPSLARVAMSLRDTLRVGGSLRELAHGAGPDASSSESAQPRARVRALYDEMRAALRRGDLTAFGAAFDSLGVVLGRAGP